jgi:hypothetical protein
MSNAILKVMVRNLHHVCSSRSTASRTHGLPTLTRFVLDDRHIRTFCQLPRRIPKTILLASQ